VVSFNELDEDIDTISDEQVPLAVRLDDGDETVTADDSSITIEDEDTPLATTKSGLGGRVWWYWILIIISLLTGKVAKDKHKEENADK
jgi:hypothetical protein